MRDREVALDDRSIFDHLAVSGDVLVDREVELRAGTDLVEGLAADEVVGYAVEFLVFAIDEDEPAVEVPEVDHRGHVVDHGLEARRLGPPALDDATELRAGRSGARGPRNRGQGVHRSALPGVRTFSQRTHRRLRRGKRTSANGSARDRNVFILIFTG